MICARYFGGQQLTIIWYKVTEQQIEIAMNLLITLASTEMQSLPLSKLYYDL